MGLHKNTKKLCGGYIDKNLDAAFDACALSRGMTKTDLLTMLIREELKRNGIAVEEHKGEKNK